MSDKVVIASEKEMLEWAGIQYEGQEIPIQLRRLIWVAQNQGKRLAWRDAFQIASSQLESYPVLARQDVTSSGSVAAPVSPVRK